MTEKQCSHLKPVSGAEGFTLLELLITLAILAFIATLVAPRIVQYLDSSKVRTARIQIESLKSALDLYRIDVGRYPDGDDGLGGLIQSTASISNWNGPYLDSAEVLRDPWGNEYIYESPGQTPPFDIISYGADGKEGGSGMNTDIVG